MPRPSLPPTPSSSTDMKGKDGVSQIPLQLAFELPPPAISNTADASTISKTRIIEYPMQAAEAVKSRRRASAIKDSPKDTFALPPPPTRTRKIIQMKPRGQDDDKSDKRSVSKSGYSAAGVKGSATASSSSSSSAAAAAAAPTSPNSKKKQASASIAAGRKQARKTAHSLIERRRRSKMNEEFAQLKSMIPACTGEMHKLAILQASIEYVRYLEDCVAKLKAQHEANSDPNDSIPQTPMTAFNLSHHNDDFETPQDDDVDMAESDASHSPRALNPPSSHQSSVSPALKPHDFRHRHDSYSSVSTDYQRYGYTSATTSPAFGPQSYNGYVTVTTPGSNLTSPALNPQRDMDHEATAALLMLNSDRRGMETTMTTKGDDKAQASSGRGMSVRDLLSS